MSFLRIQSEVNYIKKNVIISLSLVLFFSCTHTLNSSKKLEPINNNVTQFGVNHLRSGVQYTDDNMSELTKLKVTKPKWAKHAMKYVPLFIEHEKQDLLVFASSTSYLSAYDLKNKKIKWKTSLGGPISVAPVYDEKTKLFYAMTNKDKYILSAIDINGKIKSKYEIKLLELYRKNNPNIQQNELSTVKPTAALAINHYNKRPYIYFAFTNSRGAGRYDIWTADTQYGLQRGVSGLVVGVFLKKNGTFLNKSPLTFFTSIMNQHKFSGFNSGIYLSGGAITLSDKNHLYVATGNGYSAPPKNMFGCSLIKLDGSSFKLSDKNSYYTVDKNNYQECFHNRIELTSSYPIGIKKDNKYIFSNLDKAGNIHLITKNNQQNSYFKHKVLKNYQDLKTGVFPIYNAGNMFLQDQKVTLLTKVNNHSNKIPQLNIYATSKEEEQLKKRGFEKKQCIGGLAKSGDTSLSLFDSGPFYNNMLIAPTKSFSFLEDYTLETLPKNKKLKSRYVNNWRTPYIKLREIGHSTNKTNHLPNGYERAYLYIYMLTRKKGREFIEFLFDIEKYTKTENKFYNYPIISNHSEFEYFKNSQKEDDCHSLSKKKFNKLYRYERKEMNVNKSSQVISFNINPKLKVNENWRFQLSENHIIHKNSFFTRINQKENKYITSFSAIDKASEKDISWIYFINSRTGKEISRYSIDGKMHFSHLIFNKYGAFVPTENNGLYYLQNK